MEKRCQLIILSLMKNLTKNIRYIKGNLWTTPNTFQTFVGVIYVTVQLRHLFDIVKKRRSI